MRRKINENAGSNKMKVRLIPGFHALPARVKVVKIRPSVFINRAAARFTRRQRTTIAAFLTGRVFKFLLLVELPYICTWP